MTPESVAPKKLELVFDNWGKEGKKELSETRGIKKDGVSN